MLHSQVARDHCPLQLLCPTDRKGESEELSPPSGLSERGTVGLTSPTPNYQKQGQGPNRVGPRWVPRFPPCPAPPSTGCLSSGFL